MAACAWLPAQAALLRRGPAGCVRRGRLRGVSPAQGALAQGCLRVRLPAQPRRVAACAELAVARLPRAPAVALGRPAGPHWAARLCTY